MSGVCRGCAGTGVGQHVSPRTIALLETVSWTWTLVPLCQPGVVSRRRDRIIYVGRDLPLADALRKVDVLLADGFRYGDEDPVPIDPAWKCEWCYGTGTPQLSVGTLSVLSAGIAQMENQLAQITERRENHEAAQRARAEGRYP